jgi:dihydroorotase-like cyclic amidohydrolase
VSTSEEVALIERGKREFHDLYAEATPHHLFLHRKNYPDYGSVLPNLAGPGDAKLLMQAVERGVIDIMGTDHAPHTVEEKGSDKPPSGFPGLETALPLLFTSYLDGSLSLGSFVRFTSTKARRLFRMGEAAVEEGNTADCVLLETGDFRIGADGYETKCRWSPFHDRKVKARVLATVMNGRIVYRPGLFLKTGARLITA